MLGQNFNPGHLKGKPCLFARYYNFSPIFQAECFPTSYKSYGVKSRSSGHMKGKSCLHTVTASLAHSLLNTIRIYVLEAMVHR